MRQTLIIFLLLALLLMPICCLAEQTILAGQIVLQNSGGQPIKGVEVSAFEATPTTSNTFGQFELVFDEKQPGDLVTLTVKKAGLEVVNRRELSVILRSDPHDLVEIVMCEAGKRNEHARIYYGIAEQQILKQYAAELARINDNYQNNLQTKGDALQERNAALEHLQIERDMALAQAKELAEKFAEVNLDEASDLYQEAFASFQTGEIEHALAILDDAKLEHALHKAQEAKQQAEEAIRQSFDNYLLKAHLCVSNFQLADAETSYQKALEISERLTQEGPDVYLPYVADISHNLGGLYLITGQYQEALTVSQRALDIYTQFAVSQPEIYLPDVANVQNKLGIVYKTQHRYSEAFTAYTISLDIRKQYAAKNPNAYLPKVAEAQNNLGLLYKVLEQYPEAIAALHQALAIREQFARDHPDTYLPFVARTLKNLGVVYVDHGQYSEALTASQRALEIFEHFATTAPNAYKPDIAETLHNLGVIYRANKQYSEALATYQRALALREQIAADYPSAYLPDVAMTLGNLGNVYLDLNQYAEAETAYQRALSIYEQFAQEHPEVYDLDVCRTLLKLCALQVKRLQENPKRIYQEQGLGYAERVIVLLQKYPDVPKTQKNMENAVTLKTYLEKLVIEP